MRGCTSERLGRNPPPVNRKSPGKFRWCGFHLGRELRGTWLASGRSSSATTARNERRTAGERRPRRRAPRIAAPCSARATLLTRAFRGCRQPAQVPLNKCILSGTSRSMRRLGPPGGARPGERVRGAGGSARSPLCRARWRPGPCSVGVCTGGQGAPQGFPAERRLGRPRAGTRAGLPLRAAPRSEPVPRGRARS